MGAAVAGLVANFAAEATDLLSTTRRWRWQAAIMTARPLRDAKRHVGPGLEIHTADLTATGATTSSVQPARANG